MKKYLALYNAPTTSIDEMMKNASPDMMKESMESWKVWMGKHQAMFVEMGAPAAKNWRVTKDGVKPMRNEVTGYSVIQAESPEDAAKMFADSPHLIGMKDAYVDVTELMDMPGM
jgi:hypothetical protein